jgi:hypothetical protein
LVPSAYDSEDEDEDASPRASTYPIGFKWYHDLNGSWGLTSVSTAKTRKDEGSVGEAAACTLTKDIPKEQLPVLLLLMAMVRLKQSAQTRLALKERPPVLLLLMAMVRLKQRITTH